MQFACLILKHYIKKLDSLFNRLLKKIGRQFPQESVDTESIFFVPPYGSVYSDQLLRRD